MKKAHKNRFLVASGRKTARGRYWLIGAAAFVAGMGLSLTSLAARVDNDVYDFLFRTTVRAGKPPRVALVVVDEETLAKRGGIRKLRQIVADCLPVVARGGPTVTAVDLTLADAGDEAEDEALEAAFRGTPNLVLAAEMMPDGSRWQEPLERFRRHARAVGHVGALPDTFDAIIREIPLERVAGGRRYWAMAVEAFRVASGAKQIESSPTDVSVGGKLVVSRWDQGRPMRVRYRPPGDLETVSAVQLIERPETGARLAGKAVFFGVTAASATRDRYFTSLSESVPEPGVEIHAQAYDTLDSGEFLDNTRALWPLLVSLGSAVLVVVLFRWTQGWFAYAGALLVLLVVHAVPQVLLRQNLVLPATGPVMTAWLAVLGCASWQYFFVRRQLAASESDRERYQQAIRFVTHEMRTPLTAIQGSSELITRYNLPEDKRKQIGQMINAESKRLAQMITTFLDVEKLSAGQMELKAVPFPVRGLVEVCIERATPLAEKKRIGIEAQDVATRDLIGDPELLEYAVYNLITNAIKYSPEKTRIRVGASETNGQATISVRDEGYGMDEKEVKKLFTKFYRAGSAEKSGEIGSGLGLSIVDQIVTLHGGRIDVISERGKGSCFTIVLPASETTPPAQGLQ